MMTNQKMQVGDTGYLIDRHSGTAQPVTICGIQPPRTKLDAMGLPLYDSRTWYTVETAEGSRGVYDEINVYPRSQVLWVGYRIVGEKK